MTGYRDVLICTVGTSLLGHLNNPDNPELKAACEVKNTKGLSLILLKESPEARSLGAEINSITSILSRGRLHGRRRLVFLVSDTPDGDFIGLVLRHYYEHSKNPHRFDAVEIHTLEGLTDADAGRFRTVGLRNLVRAIAREVKKESSERLVINATGGYKAQISFAGMIGQALEIPVCYMFERFSEVIELPPQPISLDVSFWLEHVGIFFALNHNELEENPASVDEKFSSLVDEIQVDGHTLIGLSAVGQLFHETYQHWFDVQRQMLLPPATDTPEEKKAIIYEDKNNGRHSGLESYLKKVRQVPYVTRINTFYFNPDLPLKNYFRLPAKGGLDSVEGGYSDGKATTKFNVFTTASTTLQRNAALADLLSMFGKE
ncbi:MAG TPA: CRISPR-associated protein [Desulfobacterales bacterium]|nr:CRISPR-associated protein [Desulfobacterales bacterium]